MKNKTKKYTLCCVCGNQTEIKPENQIYTGEYVCQCSQSYEQFSYMRMNEPRTGAND